MANVPTTNFSVIATAPVNKAAKTAIYIGCSDARLHTDADQVLLKTLGHDASYYEVIPGGANVLTRYADSPIITMEASRILGHLYALLTAAHGSVQEIICTNHNDCARDGLEGHGGTDVEKSIEAAQQSADFLRGYFTGPTVQQGLKELGYTELTVRPVTFDVNTGEWHSGEPTSLIR